MEREAPFWLVTPNPAGTPGSHPGGQGGGAPGQGDVRLEEGLTNCGCGWVSSEGHTSSMEAGDVGNDHFRVGIGLTPDLLSEYGPASTLCGLLLCEWADQPQRW